MILAASWKPPPLYSKCHRARGERNALVREENQTLAITLQNCLYERSSPAATGTAMTEDAEFREI